MRVFIHVSSGATRYSALTSFFQTYVSFGIPENNTLRKAGDCIFPNTPLGLTGPILTWWDDYFVQRAGHVVMTC